MGNNDAVAKRYDAITSRLAALEQHPVVQGLRKAQLLKDRQMEILQRIEKLAEALGWNPSSASPPAACIPTSSAVSRPTIAVTPNASPIQQRLEQELIDRGFTAARFVRVPADYYDQPLEFRRGCLSAASIDHLCKSIVMENTRAHPSVTGWDDPNHSKYYCVIVQYTARLHADKLKVALCELGGRKFGRQYYNMRLAAEEVNDALTGYSHNAVTPICSREKLPIILSHRITQLQPPQFWLGAGEVDLKVGLDVQEFIDAYKPIILDCTYD